MDNKELKELTNKNILITGAGGMLGSAFKDVLKHYVPNCNTIALTHQELDITNCKSVLNLHKLNPHIIIHCAAKVNADFCEENPRECYNTQVNGTKNIVELAKKTSAKFFFPQSFLIYDGKSLPVTEDTIPSPLCIYGKYKLEGERLVFKNLPQSLSVHMGGFFGGNEKDKNFVGKFAQHISKFIKEGQKSQEVGDRIWQPTYTIDLAYNCLLLLAKNKSGVYNMASHGEASFYTLACEIVNCLNPNKKIKIVPVSAEKFSKKEKAKRPMKLIMINQRLKKEGFDRQRYWKESLHEYLSNSYFKNLFK